VVDILKQQLTAGLAGVEAKKVIVAYEPVWAISSGDPYSTKKIATPEHAEKISLFIKNKFKVPKVLYGGSANATNAKEFLSQPNVDGLLVGGASLIAKDFNSIINI
jgi:triosephosphate isomerase